MVVAGCGCAVEAAECMPKPGVADLCCPTAVTCCEPSLTLAHIPDDVVAWWDSNGTLDGAPIEDGIPEATVAAWAGLLDQYTRAICVAHETLANRVCMARYAASCCVTVTVCVEAPCCCTCDCRACPTCDRECVRLDKMCVPGHRVADVTIGGESVLDAATGPSVEWCNGSWRLYNPPVGTFDVVFVLKPPTAAWEEAVKSFACDRVPCLHSVDCDTGQTQLVGIVLDDRDRGYVGNTFADDLERECCAPSIRFGTRSQVRTVRWGDCE